MNAFFIILLLLCAAMSYLLGGLNAAIIFSGLLHHEDIRTKGSGNPGFTNYKRVYGNGPATWLVLLADFAKTALPVLITALLFRHFYGMWQFGAAFAGLFCMLGHCFPVWYGFKGGKAFIAGFATLWFVDWRMAVIATVLFLVLLLFVIKIMSVCSCIAALSCPIILALLGPASWAVEVLCILSALLVIVRHRENFKRLLKGEEPKWSLKSKK